MSYQEIHRRRLALQAALEEQDTAVATAEPPEWQQVRLRRHPQEDGASGVQYQKCGGGRRIIRKKIGGG